MGNTTLFIIGFCIFVSYMFFLVRMISKQHNIQKNSNPTFVDVDNPAYNNDKSSN